MNQARHELQKYEAVVVLKTGKLIRYNNISQGLIRFHAFVSDRFAGRYANYTIRRIVNKEIIGQWCCKEGSIRAIELFTHTQSNKTNTGFFVRVPFLRGAFTIHRNLFFANTTIMGQTNISITIKQNIYQRGVHRAIAELCEYFQSRGQTIGSGEIVAAPLEHSLIVFPAHGNPEYIDFP